MKIDNNKYSSNYREYTLSAVKANIYGTLGMIPSIFVVYLYLYLYGIQAVVTGLGNLESDLALLVVLLIVGTVMHEGLHGLTWSWFGHISMKKIRFGMHWKLLTPYAHCKVPLEANAYRWGVVMPGLVVGLIPAIIGIVAKSPIFLWFGTLFIMGAGGDFITLWLLRKVPGDYLIEDHPTKVGCIVWPSTTVEFSIQEPEEEYVHFDIPKAHTAKTPSDLGK